MNGKEVLADADPPIERSESPWPGRSGAMPVVSRVEPGGEKGLLTERLFMEAIVSSLGKRSGEQPQ